MSASSLFLPKNYKEGERFDQFLLCYSINDTCHLKTLMKQMKEDKFKSFLKECNNTSAGVMMSHGNREASEGVYYCCHYGIFYEDFL